MAQSAIIRAGFAAASAAVVTAGVAWLADRAGVGTEGPPFARFLATYVAALVAAVWITARPAGTRALSVVTARRWLGIPLATLSVVCLICAGLGMALLGWLVVGMYTYVVEHPAGSIPSGANVVRFDGLAPMASLTPEQSTRLRLYLARDRRWQVTTWGGRQVAFLRGGSPAARTTSVNGYVWSDDAMSAQYRLALYLDGAEQPRYTSGRTVASADQRSAVVTLLKPPLVSVTFDSRLWIAGRGVAVEVFEQSGVPERDISNRLLRELGEQLNAALAAASDIALDELLEPGSVEGVVAQALEVVADDAFDTAGHGVYTGRGFVNPGEEGWVHLRAFHAHTGNRLSLGSVADARELVGWSPLMDRRYHYEFEFMLRDAGGGARYEARFELWFIPANGGAERQLASASRLVRNYIN